MPAPILRNNRHFTEAARKAAAAARAAKRETADTFGFPEMFIVKAGERTFTWELRRFGGVLLERGIEAFVSEALARVDGEAVMATLCASPESSASKQERRWRASPSG